MKITDWTNLGIFPLQDHERDVPIGMRKQITGTRVVQAQDEDEGLTLFGREQQLGTIGDIHPWSFWQTANRGTRDTGSWAMSFAALTMEVSGRGSARAHPLRYGYTTDPRYHLRASSWPSSLSTLPRGVSVLAIPTMEERRQIDVLLHTDSRIIAAGVGGPGSAGTLVCDMQPDEEICMDGSLEPGVGGRHARIHSMMRVIAMAKMQNDIGLGIGNSVAWNLGLSQQDSLGGYGMVYGRVDAGAAGPRTGGGGGAGPITPRPPQGPITPSDPNKPPRGGGWRSTLNGFGEDEPSGVDVSEFGRFEPAKQASHGVALMAHIGACGPLHVGHQADQHQIGVDADGHPVNSGHISTDAYIYRNQKEDGPFFFEGDYPHPPPLPIPTKVHLTWDSSLQHKWVSGSRRGKWRWYSETDKVTPETRVPTRDVTNEPKTPSGPGPITPGPGSPVPPVPGGPGGPGPITPKGGGNAPKGPTTPPAVPPVPPRGGGWRPTTPGPGNLPPGTTPRPGGAIPAGPTTPIGLPPVIQPSGPTRSPWDPPPPVRVGPDGNVKFQPPHVGPGEDPPGSFGSGEGNGPTLGGRKRATARKRVGETQRGDEGLFQILYPFSTGFADLAFRPQLMAHGAESFTHDPTKPAEEYFIDEVTRPQVLAMRTWGSQTQSGDWSYAESPYGSRARGGTAYGGVLFCPPAYELEDYLLDTPEDVAGVWPTIGYVAAAPGVAFALGTPRKDVLTGGMAARSILIGQSTIADANHPLVISQLDASAVATELLRAELDAGGDRRVWVVGTSSLRVPRGTSVQRPVTLAPAGGEIRSSTDRAALSTQDVPEFYDAQVAGWRPMAGHTVTFTATGLYIYQHEYGVKPTVQVLSSTGAQVECCVLHPDVNHVALRFDGTLTDAVLVLGS